MRNILFLAASALAAGSANATPPPRMPLPPKLIVAISVDQFSADLFDEYRPHFAGGLARLAGGTVFRNGYQSHAATETCPGHSTILTGNHPAHTGIIANVWVDQGVKRSDLSVYCAEDESAPGTSSSNYKVSPVHLLVPTLGELMKARWPGSRNVAVSGKDRAAVMMTGHNVDQRWYWNGKTFTSDLTGVPVPQALVRADAAIAAALAEPRPGLEPTPYCASKARPVPLEGGGKPVGGGALARAAGDANGFRASPELDGATLAIAAALVDEMRLGRGNDPDLLAVSLSATDYVGHTYGTEGQEMCLQLTELDREIGDFLSALDARGLNYAVVLTADHGGKDVPERQRSAGFPGAQRVDPALAPATIGKALVARLGLKGPGLFGEGSFGDIYLDGHLGAADRKRLLTAAVAAYRAHPQVEAVFTGDQLAATPMPGGNPTGWSLLQRARASYYKGRSGDLIVLLKRDVTPIADTSRYVATHGSPWDYDRRVPILFWRNGFPARGIERPVDTVDILPTLAGLIGLPYDFSKVDGLCLPEAPSASCPSP